MKTAWAFGVVAVMLASPVAAQQTVFDEFAPIPGRDARMQAVSSDVARYQPGGAYYQPRQRYAANVQAPARAPVYGTVAQRMAPVEPAPQPVPAETLPPEQLRPSLKTPTSVQIGVQISDYRYQEPDVQMKNTGLKYGANALLTANLYNNWFAMADLRAAVGDVRYKGSGTEDGVADVLSEIRLAGGYDLLFGNFAVSPYAGLGFRYLLNDGNGHVTDTNAGLYRRESRYFFAPMGLNPRVLLNNGAKLSLVFEYDHLIKGWQSSELSDVNGYPNLNNPQYTGYGLRGSFMYEAAKWSVGPFFNYWNINDSKTKCGVGSVYVFCGYEPHNQTLEYGMQVRYRLY